MITARRIITTGASGVGKTTLVEKLAPLLSLPTIPELGRLLCSDMGFERIGDIPDQEDFKQRVLEKQIEEENRLGSFISDRSTLDCWVLWQRWNICSAMTWDTESYYEKARKQAERYTHIIYIPPLLENSEDGFRWTDPDYRKQIDRMIRATLYDWNLWTITLQISSENITQRLGEVTNWLK